MSNADWWAKQLGVKAQPQQSNPMPPSQQPMTPYTPPQPQPQVAASKAMSSNQKDMCPNCGGNNYMSVQNTKPRCYDCGYPKVQQGSGVGGVSSSGGGKAIPARGQSTGSFQPHVIVDRIS
mgnify:CR=1 FL=1